MEDKYYKQIKKNIIDNEVYSKVKDYFKEKNRVITYFEIGRLLNEAGKHYGDNIIDKYSKKLVIEVGKKYNRRTLFRMKQFYNVFSNEKVTPMVTQLTWTHYLLLMSIKDYDEIIYYIKQCTKLRLSKRELELKIKSKEYQRLPIETKNNLINQEKIGAEDFVKNPILIQNSYNYTEISEKILQKLVLENIESFMKELGNNFSFIGSEHKLKIGNTYNYIDLLLYNIEFNCYVVIELKVTELKKEHIGQIQVYMNYIDNNLKKINQNKTIGIIICKKDNKYVIEYCSDNRIVAREYELV